MKLRRPTFFCVFTFFFQNPKKHDFTFFKWLTTFSRTLVDLDGWLGYIVHTQQSPIQVVTGPSALLIEGSYDLGGYIQKGARSVIYSLAARQYAFNGAVRAGMFPSVDR